VENSVLPAKKPDLDHPLHDDCRAFVWPVLDASPLKKSIIPLTFLMVYPMMVNLQIDKVFSREGQRCQLVTQIINLAIIPFVAFFLGRWFSPASRWWRSACCLRHCCRPAA
jgi:ACR3 family arsenite efflux pump ArsB